MLAHLPTGVLPNIISGVDIDTLLNILLASRLSLQPRAGPQAASTQGEFSFTALRR